MGIMDGMPKRSSKPGDPEHDAHVDHEMVNDDEAAAKPALRMKNGPRSGQMGGKKSGKARPKG
jgi:hypothetical protein